MEITLTKPQFWAGIKEGVRRRVNNIERGSTHHNNSPALEGWNMDIEGACGELAFALACGLPWTGQRSERYDVEPFQVRTTKYPRGRLLLYEGEPSKYPDDLFVLVVGEAPEFRIVGYCKGSEVPTIGVFRDLQRGRPCWQVEQSALTPIGVWLTTSSGKPESL